MSFGDRFAGIVGDHERGSTGFRLADDLFIRVVPRRAGQDEVEREPDRSVEPAVCQVVAVADHNNGLALDGPEVFLDGHDVGHDLTRVHQIGQAVDDRHRRRRSQFVDLTLVEPADHDAVDEAAHDPSHIGNRLTRTHADLLIGNEQ